MTHEQLERLEHNVLDAEIDAQDKLRTYIVVRDQWIVATVVANNARHALAVAKQSVHARD